jgi:hypothetical protein
MLKGAGGVKKKPPPGVPADAADISDDAGLFKRVLTAGDPSAGSPPQGAKVQVRVFRGRLIPCPSHPMPVPSRRIPSHPLPSRRIVIHPIASRRRILSRHIPSRPIPSQPVPSHLMSGPLRGHAAVGRLQVRLVARQKRKLQLQDRPGPGDPGLGQGRGDHAQGRIGRALLPRRLRV